MLLVRVQGREPTSEPLSHMEQQEVCPRAIKPLNKIKMVTNFDFNKRYSNNNNNNGTTKQQKYVYVYKNYTNTKHCQSGHDDRPFYFFFCCNFSFVMLIL